ncbi:MULTISPECIES: glycosyltransferase [Aeromonas]|uniref:glycosyltransferase n=1 Tax=Aeromonas TaxID=642 RepID=UPI0015F9F4AF|nr:glycosyltransferase [Aeromonas media]
MKFVFYNPSRIVGGAEHLFFRLYSFYKNQGYDCKVVDYFDGAFFNLGVPPEDLISIGSIRQAFQVECDFFILPPNMAYEALYNVRMKDSVRIIFWSIHPYNCIPILPFAFYKRLDVSSLLKRVLDFSVLRKQIYYARALFKDASEKNALVFMDGENYSYAQSFIKLSVGKKLLPIPSPVISYLKVAPEGAPSSLNFFWVGRLVDFKIGALNRLIRDLDTWCQVQQVPVTLHVVGSGELEGHLLSATHFKIEKHGYLDNQTLHSKLATMADAVFSMGTSVLESAAIGVPSFIVMPTYETVGNEYSYMPLPETQNFDLGSFSVIEGARRFEELTMGKYFEGAYGATCRTYVLEHHDLAQIAAQLLVIAQDSSFFFSDVRPAYRKRFFSRFVFSVLKGK